MAVNPFESISGNFVRNPLGIIALFIVLVYAMAGVVAVSKNFTGWHLDAFVVFLIGFPFVVLAVFYRLVVRHGAKLYSPEEIGAENFFRLHQRPLAPTDLAGRIDAWVRKSKANRERLGQWLDRRGISVSVTVFINSAEFLSLQQAAIAELEIPETNG